MLLSDMLNQDPKFSEKIASAINKWIMEMADNTEEGGGSGLGSMVHIMARHWV